MKKKIIQYSLKLILLFAITLSFFACQTLGLVAEAQDDFNAGAEIENATKFSQTEENNVRIEFANTKYALALSKVEKALNEKNKLKKNKIYGSALTIKALCELELGLYDEAEKTSEEAKVHLMNMNQPRDLAINESMEGLVKAKMAYDLLTKFSIYNEETKKIKITDDQYEEIKSLTKRGIVDIDTASKSLINDDILKYFAVYKISMIDVWRLAALRADKDDLSELKDNIKKNLRELRDELGAESKIFIYYWKDLGELNLDT